MQQHPTSTATVDSTTTLQKADTIWICPKAEKMLRLARNVAQTEATILISGETGTGKEIIAREIHRTSHREGPLITVNCGAIPEQLVASELFGYEKGSFTGANQSGHIGKFEAADKGTLFLDEIGEMPFSSQIALLRVLEEKKVTRIGSHTPKPIDVRIIAATHRNLAHDIHENRFRADLYYRLCEIELTLPALRERTDLFVLADYFLRKIAMELKVSQLDLEDSTRNQLASYHWPGNIRELQHILRQAAYQAYFIRRSTTITEEDLHFTSKKPTESVIHISEEDRIAHAIKESGGNLSLTARLLGIGRTTLYRKIHRYPQLKEIKKQLKFQKNERADA